MVKKSINRKKTVFYDYLFYTRLAAAINVIFSIANNKRTCLAETLHVLLQMGCLRNRQAKEIL